MLTTIILISAIGFYLLASYWMAIRLYQPQTSVPTSKTKILLSGLLAATFHAYVLFGNIWLDTGLNFGFFNAASLTAWLTVVLILLTGITNPVDSLILLLLPLASTLLALEAFFPTYGIILQHSSWQLDTHIFLSITAFSFLVIAVLQGLLLAMLDRQLKSRSFSSVARKLPPLETMEILLFRFIGVGFFLLSLALISGVAFLEDIFAQHLVHKTVLSIIAWLVFAVLLYGRWRYGWRGAIALRWTYSGFLSLALAYFGSKFVLDLILK